MAKKGYWMPRQHHDPERYKDYVAATPAPLENAAGAFWCAVARPSSPGRARRGAGAGDRVDS